MTFKPMLASPVEDTAALTYPLLASPKLDGIRCIIIGGKVYSRKLKLIPNKLVQALFGRPEYEFYDGELIVGPSNAKDVYHRTYSGVMSEDGEPDVRFYVFDHIARVEDGYLDRSYNLKGDYRVEVLEQTPIHSEDALLCYEEQVLKEGYEGVMVRAVNAPYKYGRSTTKQGWLLKLKRFVDDEAEIVGVEELMHNANEATTDELGHTKRSTHQAGLVGRDTLGALVCVKDGIKFNIGTGFTADQREALWAIRDSLPGMFAKFKHFQIGAKEAPRFPVFLGLRDPIDM